MRLMLFAGVLAAVVASGCQNQPVIPASAVSMAASRGPTVSYRAPDAGVIYIQNRSSNELVYSGYVAANQVVALDATAGRVVVGDRIVMQRPLGMGDEYVIYLDRQGSGVRRTVERRTVIERSVRHGP